MAKRGLMLGQTVRDSISGFTGVIVGRHEYLHGGIRFTVQPPIDKEGRLPAVEDFDASQLIMVKGNNAVGFGQEKVEVIKGNRADLDKV